MELKKLRDKAGELVKKYKYVLIVLLAGIGLMLIPNQKEESKSLQVPTQSTFEDQTDSLSRILSQIQGAGKVELMLTLSAGEQTVYQLDQTSDASGRISTETVIVTDSDRNQQGMVQKILAPEYRGAIVLCQGAADPSVRLAIVEAVSDATGLSTDRISVLKMK